MISSVIVMPFGLRTVTSNTLPEPDADRPLPPAKVVRMFVTGMIASL